MDVFFLVVIIILLRILRSSVQSLNNTLKFSGFIKLDFFNNSSQYKVSSHSFCAIESLCIKSAFDSAFKASRTFAPIEVPDFNNYLDKTNSFSIKRDLQI
jgi:hypothetical protein